MAKGQNEPEDSDEDILNVLREADEMYLTSKDVSQPLSIKKRQTGGRLNELEAEGRVVREEFGRTHVWRLADNEPETPVDPTRGNVILWSNRGKRWGGTLWMAGKWVIAYGALLAFISLTASVEGVSPPIYTRPQLLAYGWAFLGGGGVVLLVGAVLQGLGRLLPRVVSRKMET